MHGPPAAGGLEEGMYAELSSLLMLVDDLLGRGFQLNLNQDPSRPADPFNRYRS
jgi:hypothetical protein